jgi:hypothetical protein
LFDDPLVIWMTVALIVSVVQHHRAMKFIDKRASELEDRMQRLEVLMRSS